MTGFEQIESHVGEYFDRRLSRHGATAQGAAWATGESQRLRFEKLLEVVDASAPFSINDYGCGYGALADYLEESLSSSRSFDYAGYDLSQEMVRAARERLTERGFTIVGSPAELPTADFTVASGVFNVKLDATTGDWECLMLDTLDRMAAVSRRGFAFNCLQRPTDPSARRPELYYTDPLAVFEHCRRRFSPKVALLADYDLPELTVIVRTT